MLPSSVILAENTAQFHHHLNAYLYNLAYLPYLPGISINLWTSEIVN